MQKSIQSVGKTPLPIYHFTTLKRFHALTHESFGYAYPYSNNIPYQLHWSCTCIGGAAAAAPTSKLRTSCKLDKLQASCKSSYV